MLKVRHAHALKFNIFFLATFCSLALSNERTLAKQFVSFTKLQLNSNFEFICGEDQFRLSKKLFQKPILYKKHALDWRKIDTDTTSWESGSKQISLNIRDTGVSFESNRLFSIQHPYKNFLTRLDNIIELPIYHGDIENPSRFFLAKKRDLFYSWRDLDMCSTYQYEIDFYNNELKLMNKCKTSYKFILDGKKYAKSQKMDQPNAIDISGAVEDLYTDAHKRLRNFHRLTEKQKISINEALERYEKENVEVVLEPGQDFHVRSCYPVHR